LTTFGCGQTVPADRTLRKRRWVRSLGSGRGAGLKDKRRFAMPKYLIQASYTVDGIQGLLKDGGSKRKAAAEQAIKGLGGSIEAFYFAFGDADAVVIADAPDNQTAAAVSLAVTASGAVRTKITVLMTPEEMDQAAKKSVSYRPPGR